MNVPILVLGVVSAAVGILLLVVGRRRRLNRAATTGVARTSAMEIVGIGLTVAGLGSLARAF